MAIRDYPQTTRIYIDMDGVIADFEEYCNRINTHFKYAKLIPGTYLNLKPIPDAIDAVQELMGIGYQTWFLTKIPGENPESATEKIKWLNIYFPFIKDHLTITAATGAIGIAQAYFIYYHPEWASAHNLPVPV